ncbi:hypothetical protein ONZ45_g5665 [Pleurotus djamor]|nr:hypothetical protein ONZ45_g5665 [Pleurotus djamor]
MNPPAMRHAARQETTTSGGAPPTSTLLPQFFFSRIDDMYTCTPATIEWAYAGPSSDFQMVITNRGVDQAAPAPAISTSSTSRPPSTLTNLVPRAEPTYVISEPVSTNIAPFSPPFTWQEVTVPEGWYKLVASLPSASFSAESRTFFVHNSTDVSCLISPPPPPPTSSQSSTSPVSSPSQSQTDVPVVGASSANISSGAIAGSVIGGVAIVVACIAAFLFIRYSKRSGRSRGGAGGSSNWGGLGSVDSVGGQHGSRSAARPKSFGAGAAAALGFAANDKGTTRHNPRADSVDPILASDTRSPSALPRPSQSSSISKEDISSSVHNPFDEKYGVVDSMPPLPMHRDTSIGTTHTRRTSVSSTRVRRLSIDRNAELIPMTPSPSTPSTPYTPTHIPSRSQSGLTSPSAPSILPAGGISSPTSSNRRSARKPVPSYQPDDISLSPFLPGAEPPRSTSSARHSTADILGGGEEDRSSTHSARGIRPPGIPELNHKSSFGPGDNRPVHYLIPDMPPPQRD